MPRKTPPGRRAQLAAVFSLCALSAACPGSPPAAPPNTLVRLDAEPPGPHCASGGTAIRMGPDSNGNGALDEDEPIESRTRYVCDVQKEAALHFGNLQIHSSADLSKLDGVEYLVGDLFIRGDLVPEVDLPRLQRVSGALTLGWEYLVPLPDGGSLPPMSTLRLPALRSVGNLFLTLPYVRTLDLSSLESVGDQLVLDSLGQLTSVDLPALRSVGGELRFHSTAHFDAQPQAFRAPLLASVTGDFVLDHNVQLATVELPALAQVGRLSVQGNASLTALSLPALAHAGPVTVSHNEVLTTLSLPRLGAGSGTTLVTANPALSQCTALALEVQRRRAGYLGDFLRSGNQEDAACASNTADTCVPFTPAGASSTYALCLVERSFSQAGADCASAFPDGHLAVFETQAEHLRLQEAVKDGLAVPTNVWLGYSDEATEGAFRWTRAGASYSPQAGDTGFWSPSQPDNGGGDEDCVLLLGMSSATPPFVPGYALDVACERPQPALCEVP